MLLAFISASLGTGILVSLDVRSASVREWRYVALAIFVLQCGWLPIMYWAHT